MIKVSYAITTHNEGGYVKTLLDTLTTNLLAVGYEWEIVVLDDMSTEKDTLDAFEKHKSLIRLEQRAFGGDFATHKNHLSSLCVGDYIFQIDADELPSMNLVMNLEKVILANNNVDVFDVPRVNTVVGIGKKHLVQWGWKISSSPNLVKNQLLQTETPYFELLQENDLVMNYQMKDNGWADVKFKVPIINWPDMQKRIWKNAPDIRWEGRVHETLVGYKTIGTLPTALEFSLFHEKDIRRQEHQNQLYANLQR